MGRRERSDKLISNLTEEEQEHLKEVDITRDEMMISMFKMQKRGGAPCKECKRIAIKLGLW